MADRADTLFIKKLMSITLDGVECLAEEVATVGTVFKKKGGSWEKVFKGSSSDIAMLKDIILDLYKKDYFTKKDD